MVVAIYLIVNISGFVGGAFMAITYTEDGRVETFEDEMGLDALAYEVLDMESTINTGVDHMHLEYTVDVMKIMTNLRREWGIKYPEEEEA